MNLCGTVSHAHNALMMMKTDLWHVLAAYSGHSLSVSATRHEVCPKREVLVLCQL